MIQKSPNFYRKRKHDLTLLREGHGYLRELRKLTNAIQSECRYHDKNANLRIAKGKGIVLDPREEKVLDGLFTERYEVGKYLLEESERILKEFGKSEKMKEKTIKEIYKERYKNDIDNL
jgi:hypothetical protein